MAFGKRGERLCDVERRQHSDLPRGLGLDHDQVRHLVLEHELLCAVRCLEQPLERAGEET